MIDFNKMQKQNNTKSSLKLVLFFDQVYDKENQNPLNQYDSNDACSYQTKRQRNLDQQEIKHTQYINLPNKIDFLQANCNLETAKENQKLQNDHDQEIKSFELIQCQEKEELFFEELNKIKDDKKLILTTKRSIKQLKDYAIEQATQDQIRKIIKTGDQQLEQMNEKFLYDLENQIQNNLEYLNEKCMKINEAIIQKKNGINTLRKRKILFQNKQETEDSQKFKILNIVKIQKF
ncbi:hypothetical protein TTHERM_00529550 (macronuclear) [Tetrahymena thermophila SB210]|uniref:Uncharacterized protein n=1 Tax=Tetrahymena thermophila (strain SB210) TaxID=312017 RepID=I7LZV8_TETTS|nr:hypothetical protein TTHERM_00529550 [Tetrahymena thermophila SB210]EAR85003.2 hypothetical protein TTHERM_00529550 [Tetrahymena thermophila SB210]|eukprot:XP_001032666.2 hypothetical protein TTHERM_00529550 [Tetrahymena thermophila SB210]